MARNNSLAESLVQIAIEHEVTVATAESCTGGMVAASITDVSGSSAIFSCGIVAYSNESKMKILDIDPYILNTCGPCSPEIAEEMALGVLALSRADIAIANTGEAGPISQGSRPVGTVFISLAIKNGGVRTQRLNLEESSSRKIIRQAATDECFKVLLGYFE